MAKAGEMSSYWRGLRDGLPFLLVVSPFALLFGIVATEAGLTVLETLTFSVAVIAGAAQFTALELMTENAPTFVVLASAIAVNLRLVMYSAALTPHLGDQPLGRRALVAYFTVDQTYATAAAAFDARPDMTPAEKFAYYLGVVTPICFPWYICTVIGAKLGAIVPLGSGIAFALPLVFIAMTGPALRTRAHMVAAFVATLTSLAAAGLPFNAGLLVGAVAGMLAGAEMERRGRA